jgi:hypothetical protein
LSRSRSPPGRTTSKRGVIINEHVDPDLDLFDEISLLLLSSERSVKCK